MNSSIRMNNFLQKMLKKGDEEFECEKVIMDSSSLKVEYSPRSNKSNWMRKLGAYSPMKRDASPSIRSPSRPITPKPAEYRNDYRRRSVPEPLTPKNSKSTNDMPNLEDIIQEFEMGFLSPTKQETKKTIKSGHFVKKIVAAFEEKYKGDKNLKVSPERASNDQKNTPNVSTISDEEMEESAVFLGTTYVIDSLESRLTQFLDSSISKEINHPNERPISIDLSKCSFAMDEELTFSTPAKKSPESSNHQSFIFKETLEETVKNVQQKTLVRSNSSMKRERQPKIVGAFLKKPIEVDDTSIDWIPITNNKRLPRKKSFKRLLSVLTGKSRSSEKSSKLYCSQMNLQEETTKELHDSGYDEKSCSSSSLTSLVSITDLLLQQDHYEIEADRRTATLTTFKRSCSSVDQDNIHQDELLLADDYSDTCSVSSKKLLLEEIPRSECRLSLGPVYKPKFVTKSLDRRETNYRIKNDDYNEDSEDEILTPLASPLPKHPFISVRMNSEIDDDESSLDGKKDINFIEFEKIELRRDFDSWEFSSEVTYDVPRRYLSKSEPGLYKQQGNSNEVVYDIPKPTIPQRPKSSVYEDALSLKRRNANFSSSPPASGFYAFPSQEEPHYATVKPRNTRVNPSRELLRSVGDLNSPKLKNGIYYARGFGETRYL